MSIWVDCCLLMFGMFLVGGWLLGNCLVALFLMIVCFDV